MHSPSLAGRGGDRIAFFGGSFDPPHLGHLAIARAARSALRLDAVLFAPVGVQPLKAQGSTASFEDRMAMTRLAIESERGFELSLADAPRSGSAPNYTIDTLERLRAEMSPSSECYCLMGADAFSSLRQWHRAAELPFVATLIVASRPGQPLEELERALPEGLRLEPVQKRDQNLLVFALSDRNGRKAALYLLPNVQVEISASGIRSRIAAGGSTSGLIPEAVAHYIRIHDLYR